MRKWIPLCALLVCASASAAVPSSQRQALIAFYDATGGDTWNDKTGWKGAEGTECNWFGVECDNDGANVLAITTYDNNLRGTIPPQIAQLTKLQTIYLAGNQLEGPLPKELGSLVALEQLNLSYNAFTGAIPPELAQLTNLVMLDLSVNQLTGAIPTQLGALAKLEHFGVTDNHLTGAIPKELGNLTALTFLHLGYNQFDGTIPPEFGRLKNLEDLSVGNNKLHGPIPAELGDLSALRALDLSTNEFAGGFPAVVLRLTNLEGLALGANQFTGEIPRGISALTRLQVLALDRNQFTGAIPSELATLKNLGMLELEYNDLTGPIPTSLGDLSELTWIDLGSNELTGTIPASFGRLAKLELLLLYDNRLEGPLPPELGALSHLTALYLGTNRLSGSIPESFRNLRDLREVYLTDNNFTGSIPTWIGELTGITDCALGYNQFSGSIPPSMGNLANLIYFDAQLNQLTGRIPPELGNARKLINLDLSYNQLEGPLPATFGQLENMTTFGCEFNALSGPLPREIGNLRNLEYWRLGNNDFDGPLPAELGNLTKLYHFSAFGNRFSGAIPKELGKLTEMREIDLSANALRGTIPSELLAMTKLDDGRSDINYNALVTNDSALRALLARKLYDPNWEATQTVTPTNVHVTQTTDRSATLEWTPIQYQYDNGGYQVVASKTPGGAPVAIATTATKEVTSIVVRNLTAQTTYYFTVAAITHPHGYQNNLLASDATAPVSTTTTARIVAPPEVVLSEPANGLVQVDGVPRNEDSFTLTNFGDVSTTITLVKEGDFFTTTPDTFVLDGGKSRVVTVKSLAKPVGSYYGYALATGAGTGDGVLVDIVLLSSAKPAGTVSAQAISTRIESAGVPGSTSVGVARFKNVGTATLSGILVSDVPWVQPPHDPITIEPGTTAAVNFNIVRSKRPDVAGALTANLGLLYVDGSSSGNLRTLDTSTAGVSITKITVVDVTTPTATPSTLGPSLAGEIALFAPGIASFQRAGGAYGSNLSIVNARSAAAINDLRLFFTPAGATQTALAELTPLASSSSVSLVNVVTNVYGATEGVGTLQVRSADWESLGVQAQLTNLKPAGTFTGDLPVFRADRSVGPGEAIYLAGVRNPANVYVQETNGNTVNAHVEFLDANGGVVASIDRALGAFGLAELKDAVPAGAATAVVTNQRGSNGRIVAYARVSDDTTGDTWSVVDWSRYFRYATTEAMRLPVADGRGGTAGAPTKRRIITNAVTPRATTDLALFNPATTEARAKVRVIETSGRVAERDIVVGAHKTMFLTDVGASALTTTAHVIVEPTRGELVASARSARSGAGAAIPVVAAASGLRVGQSQVFAGLDDSTTSTVLAATPATFRTSYGFVETSGESVTVRARLLINEERALASASVEREFVLEPRQQLVLPEVLRSFAGDARDTLFGDLHGLRLEIEVTAGRGSIVPFVIITDNGSGDWVMRLE